MVKIFGKEETKAFFKNSIKVQKYTKRIISEYNIDCDISGDLIYEVAHHPDKFKLLRERENVYKNEFNLETQIYSKKNLKTFSMVGRAIWGIFL